MAKPSAEEITASTRAELSNTPYACSELTVLSGGTANFLYKGTLTKPLPDGTTHVVVKHAEDFVKNNPAFSLSTDRCRFEEASLEAVQAGLGAVSAGQFTVKTPRLLHYNPRTNTQVQEYAPGTLDLKNYALTFWTPTSSELKSQCHDLGRSLGSWLRKFHNWADLPEQEGLRGTVKQNVGMQKLKHLINYPNSLSSASSHPQILGNEEVMSTIKEVVAMAEKELQDESKLGIIHGDFWTGNALVPARSFGARGDSVTVDIIDWELVQMGVRPLDLGQMIAELYELKLFKAIDAGVWIIEGFSEGYGTMDDEFAFRTSIHVGCHLLNFSGVPGWGTQEKVESVVDKGVDILVKAWKKDRSWFEGMELGCLFVKKQ
ncbi:uncharacterized protein MKZ38_010751 [Zalerion maritima]|uniref:Aminoglycoside phosphotransferase domain-containing protein n=1 Tax=Zalerion maritima TaxID=339359 RepID=A0AAD5S035_9PEZI|nr:uncharacterized protein MKZ38_010751 [Zalerion maritima]